MESVTYFNKDADVERDFSPDSTGQRSIIRRIEVTFSRAVSVPTGAVTDDSFIIESTSGLTDGKRVGIDVVRSDFVDGKQIVVLQVTGKELVEAISRKRQDHGAMLIDGEYRLTVDGAKLNLDANGADFGVKATDDFFRLFGDADGDGTVDGTDHSLFTEFDGSGNRNFIFDFDSRPNKKTLDRVQYLKRFGTRLF